MKAWEAVKPYLERESLAAFFLGVSSGFPYAMIGATLTTRLAQDGIDKKTVTAFTLAFLVYNLKLLWAWIVDGVRIPLLGRLGQRVSWLLVAGVAVIAAVVNLALVDPSASIQATVVAAVLVGVAGATYDIVIDAYRIEMLEPRQLGVGSGMSQYGWRIGSAVAGALALVVAARIGWAAAYIACAAFALPAMLTGLIVGEPARHVAIEKKGLAAVWNSIVGPFVEFLQRTGAWLVLLFILRAQDRRHAGAADAAAAVQRHGLQQRRDRALRRRLRLLGVPGRHFRRRHPLHPAGHEALGAARLVLMGVSNLSFALLAAAGHSNAGLAAAMGFENFASGFGGVVVVAYFSALCDLRFTATQYALISAAASVVGRLLTGTTAGRLIEAFGYVNFYLLTTLAALPGILLFWLMMRKGLIDRALGSAGRSGR